MALLDRWLDGSRVVSVPTGTPIDAGMVKGKLRRTRRAVKQEAASLRPRAWIWASEETATGVRVNFTPGGSEIPVSGRGEREGGLPGAPNRRTRYRDRDEWPLVYEVTVPSFGSCRIFSGVLHSLLTVGGDGINYELSCPVPPNPATDSAPTPCPARRAPGGRFLSFRDVLRRSA